MSTVAATDASVVVARILTPRDFGIAATLTVFISMAQRFTNFGRNTAFMRLPELRRDHSATVFVVNVVLRVAIGGALALAAPWLGGFYHSPEATLALPVAGLTFAIAALGTVHSALMARQLKFREFATIDVIYVWGQHKLSGAGQRAGLGRSVEARGKSTDWLVRPSACSWRRC